MMGPLQFTAVRTFDTAARLQRIMGPALVAPGSGNLLFWNCHRFQLSFLPGRTSRRFLNNILAGGKPAWAG
jgi:hypothetical protein